MKSIRRRQIVTLLLGTSMIVVVAGVAHYVTMRRTLTRELDSVLVAKVGALGALLDYEPPFIEFDFADEAMPEYSPGPAPEYFQLWLNGKVFKKSSSLDRAELPYQYGQPERPVFFYLELPDGRPGRAAGIEVPVSVDYEAGADLSGKPRAVIVAARGREDLLDTLASLAILLLVEGVLICAFICVLVFVTIGQAMIPLRRLGDQVDAIDSAKLDQRVDQDGLPDELRPIAAGLNRLLARLEEGFRRERRITANIAHELRTPVAELRTATEVSLRWEDDFPLARRAVTAAREISEQMEHIVKSLLKLARIESGQAAFRPQSVDLSQATADCWSSLLPRVEPRHIRLTFDVEPGLIVATDPDGLELILVNLLSNAVEHCPEGGWIHCAAEVNTTTVRLDISNANDLLTPEDLPHLAEAFWTKDAARSASQHAGLGVTLVKAVAGLMGVETSFDVNGNEFRVSLVIPRPVRTAGSNPAVRTKASVGPKGRMERSSRRPISDGE